MTRSLPTRHDVIVVGARAAGAATAMLLARQGLDVLLIDRGHEGSDTLSTLALMRSGVIQLSRWGLLDSVVDAGTPAIRRTLFLYGEETIDVEIGPAFGVEALYAPRRTVLDHLLAEAAAEAGAEVRYRNAMQDVETDESGRVVGIVAQNEERQEVRLGARMLIGADGRASSVARAVGAENTMETPRRRRRLLRLLSRSR